MQVPLITDTHFGGKNDSSIFLDFQEKFFSDVFFPKLDVLGSNTIIHLGDFFDRRKFVNMQTLYRVKKMFLDPLQERNIKMYLILGNHCTFFKNTNEINSPNLLCKEYDNVKIINNPQTIDLDGLSVGMVPWICPDNQLECEQYISTTSCDILFGHFAINGFVMHAG